jgi:hypothetical protein
MIIALSQDRDLSLFSLTTFDTGKYVSRFNRLGEKHMDMKRQPLWSIVLDGGEGEKIKPLILRLRLKGGLTTANGCGYSTNRRMKLLFRALRPKKLGYLLHLRHRSRHSRVGATSLCASGHKRNN